MKRVTWYRTNGGVVIVTGNVSLTYGGKPFDPSEWSATEETVAKLKVENEGTVEFIEVAPPKRQ